MTGCLIYDKLQISYEPSEGKRIGHFTPGWRLNKLKGSSNELLSFYIIVTGYYSANLDEWNIKIYPVKLLINKLVKQFIIDIAMPRLKNWFSIEKPDSWFVGHRYYQIRLNEDLTEFCILETLNDRIIIKEIKKINLNKIYFD